MVYIIFLIVPLLPRIILFPYTTLFRSIRIGQTATVMLSGAGEERFVGKITNVGQELDPTTHVVPVRIVLDNPGRRRSEEHTSELQSRRDLVCRLLLEKK